jgi:hypothetical protein
MRTEAWSTNIVIRINKGAAFHTEGVLKAYHFLQARPDIGVYVVDSAVFPGEPIEERPDLAGCPRTPFRVTQAGEQVKSEL